MRETTANKVKPGSARHYRQQAAERAMLIAAHGLAPERPVAADRYAATAGEFYRWLSDDYAAHVATHISVLASEVR